MSVFDFIDTMEAKLVSNGVEVNNSTQEPTGYAGIGPFQVFFRKPESQLDESVVKCAIHNVTLKIDIFAYDYEGVSDVKNMSDAIDSIIQSLFDLNDKPNGVQDLTIVSYDTNLDLVVDEEPMCYCEFTYRYKYQQKIA